MMTRAERTIIAMAIAVICPVSLFFLLWWISAALSIFGTVPISESSIAVAAISGLGLGVMLDIFCLKRWMPGFYKANPKLMIVVYLFWSAIAVALLMGLPFLNIILGICAGLYVGRKYRHMAAGADRLAKAARHVGIFTALVTGLEALAIGLLALREKTVREILGSLTGLNQPVGREMTGVVIITGLCIILMMIQFWCATAAARFAFRLGAAPPDISGKKRPFGWKNQP